MTLSITGRCARTGELGIALSSYDVALTFTPTFDPSLTPQHFALVVGGVGAVVGQANTRAAFVTRVMGLLRRGEGAEEALASALADEEDVVRQRFQSGVVDARGGQAGFTGSGLTREWRGHRVGTGYVAAGNVLAGAEVVDAMATAFESAAHQPLDARLLGALDAGVSAGGDRRGQRCAFLRVAEPGHAADFEIRVHEHAVPLVELRRLLGVYHYESDLVTMALQAAPVVREILADDELVQFAECRTLEAVSRIRGIVAARGLSEAKLAMVDRLLSALTLRRDVADMRFGDAWRQIAAAT